MRELTVGKNDAGRRADRFLAAVFPHLPPSLIAKTLRKRDVRQNGKRIGGDARLSEGDVLHVFLPDDVLAPPEEARAFLLVPPEPGTIAYEDENILIVEKPSGMVVHADERGGPDTLIARIQAYLYKKGEWSPEAENSFAPALCNRLDRNTSGLVIAAKNAPALRDMNEIIRERQLKKLYLCAVHGKIAPREGALTHFIRRNEKTKRVEVFSSPRPGAKTARTAYRTLYCKNGFSILECELQTGRTHQLRAQLAAAGHPIAGDSKYGTDGREGGQVLHAYKLDFSPLENGGSLSYLKGLVVEATPGELFAELGV